MGLRGVAAGANPEAAQSQDLNQRPAEHQSTRSTRWTTAAPESNLCYYHVTENILMILGRTDGSSKIIKWLH